MESWARRLLATCAAEHVAMQGEVPVLRDPAAFAEAFENARREALRRASAEAARSGCVGRGRRQALSRMSALWAPQARPADCA